MRFLIGRTSSPREDVFSGRGQERTRRVIPSPQVCSGGKISFHSQSVPVSGLSLLAIEIECWEEVPQQSVSTGTGSSEQWSQLLLLEFEESLDNALRRRI